MLVVGAGAECRSDFLLYIPVGTYINRYSINSPASPPAEKQSLMGATTPAVKLGTTQAYKLLKHLNNTEPFSPFLSDTHYLLSH
jgi:hypothetical protein